MTRNATLDYARLLAVFGIILFHAGAPGAEWGYAGLPFFLLLMGIFVAPTAEHVPTSRYISDRARRLLIPWAIWSVIYAALMVAQAAKNDRPVFGGFEGWMLLTGPALHLWFLPFAFVAGGVLHMISRTAWAGGPQSLPLLGWVGAGMAFLTLGALQAGPWPTPMGQWLFSVPALGLGLLLSVERGGRQIAGVIAVVTGAWALGWTQDLLPLTLGLGLLGLCMVVRLPPNSQSRGLADVALAIYLSHPLVGFLLVWLTGLRPDSVVSAAVVMVLSLALALIVRQGSPPLSRAFLKGS